MLGGVVLVDDRGVLDQRLERLDPALDEGLLVLGVLVLGVLGEVAVLLGVVDALGDLGRARTLIISSSSARSFSRPSREM